MSEQAEKWERQWSELLTRCHGEAVYANPGFKAHLLNKLRHKTAENREEARAEANAEDAHFGVLLQAAWRPCEPNSEFRSSLLARLKARQAEIAAETALEARTADPSIQTLLTVSYKPVAARREFQTRLLENMRERQRTAVRLRRSSRKRTIFLSAASSLAAAAAVMFVIWVQPYSGSGVGAGSGAVAGVARVSPQALNLAIPDVAAVASVAKPAVFPAAAFGSASNDAMIVPASFGGDSRAAPVFAEYRVSEAFARPALPATVRGIRAVECDDGEGWREMSAGSFTHISPGMAFRTSETTGHIGFNDGTIITMNPDSRLVATEDGLAVEQGFLLVSVPESASDRFRLHFPERDIAIEPGTDLAVMVEPRSNYAEGGAPAPLVMVIEDDASSGGLALAKGRQGVAPLFAKHVYRLDHYVTADMPGRMLCDTECQDIEKLFRMETVRESGTPKALFAGGFGGMESGLARRSTTVFTPAGFSKRGSVWVADSYRGGPTVRVSYLSDDYFGLANARRDLARALALGGEVIIDGGEGVFYEIHRE